MLKTKEQYKEVVIHLSKIYVHLEAYEEHHKLLGTT